MGALMRRYWLPAAASVEVAPGSARRVRILGEDLVVYRDTQGRAAVIDERCPHRGTSMATGCIDAEGIRCPYHGWKFNAAGACLETPAEPEDSPLRTRVRAKAYPAEELGGLIWLYMGPDPAPLLPRFDLFVWDNCVRDIGVADLPCNWLQIMENSVDPHHLEWLHGHHLAHVRSAKGQAAPTHYLRHHEKVGFDAFEFGIVKRRVLEGGSEADDDWTIGHPLVFPVMLRVGSHRQHRMQIRVPVDDTNTRHYWYACYQPAPGQRVEPQPAVPVYQVPWRNPDGSYIVHFVDGQDIMACVSQGPIADRTREILGSSDAGIALYRRMLLEQVDRVSQGLDPLGTVRDPARNTIIELPQERDKYRKGGAFLGESIRMGHAQFSPLKERILELLSV
ncbi:MAG: Rieske 2Fe-2S domain-containing protein [Phycisphaeraceae bacterium]|nr:Rieske 2Fe-2S domain-containing protein [Phycisphaeraceae bacterium]